jgi:hypothetical protein
MSEERHAWLCVVNSTNFEIICSHRVYGVPDRPTSKLKLAQVNQGDTLFFYIITPKKRILGKSKALSTMFEDKNKFPWKDRLYPYRIKLTHVENMNIPSRNFIKKIGCVNGRIPMGASIIPLSNEDEVIIDKKCLLGK